MESRKGESGVETVFVHPQTGMAPIEPDIVSIESPSASTGVLDFSACYERGFSSLVWFVMSLGADPHKAADVAQSAYAEAFTVWDRIEQPAAWLRRVAGRIFYRNLVTRETPDIRGGSRSITAQCAPSEDAS
jgi:DNA-directed RNA polymerase specialized sigma24 family protein